MTTVVNNGISYDLRIQGGALQTRVTGATTFDPHPQMVSLVGPVHYLGPWISGQLADGTYRSTRIDDLSIYNVVNSWDYDGSLAGVTPVVIENDSTPAPAPSGPVRTIEATLSMSDHQIVDGLPATTPTGFVVLSQLVELSQSITEGDLTNATAITALTNVVNALPAGITIPEVQALINTSVNQAVADEIIDDETTRQLIVDAIMAQVEALDATIVGRVAALEAKPDLEPRVTALETLTATHTAEIAAGVTKDADQDAAIGAVAAGVAGAVAVNNAQNERINQSELGISMLNQIATPIEVKIVNGAVTEVIGCSMNMVSIDNSNDRHMQVSINLGTDTNGQRRVLQGFRLMPNGTERDLGGSYSRNYEIYIAAFLKTCDGSTSVNIVLN